MTKEKRLIRGMQPDLIIINGRIWTGEPELPYAEALAVQADIIIAVGSNDQIRLLSSSNTEVVDADGHLVLPGFIDNHTHLLVGGMQLLSLNLRQAGSKAEFMQAVANRAATTSPGIWITGGGWNNDQWPGGEIPAKEWIDSMTPHNPVFLARSDLHIGFANSLALKLAGITRNTADPAGGAIVRDTDTGEPTGILKDTAVRLVQNCIPAPSEEQYDQALIAAMRHAAQVGVTSVQDITAWADWNDWKTFERFRQQEKLTLRIYARTQITEWEKQLELMAAGFCGDAWLRLGGVKGFVDGSLGSGTALMFGPYQDAPATAGLLAEQMFPAGIMQERITAADKAGLPVSIHAIGDKANHILLDIFEAVILANGKRDRRFRIEHAQHLIPADIERLARLGILASVQPGHVYEDGCWAEKRIGRQRCQLTYAFRSLLTAGASLSFGTDWPVVPLNPFQGIYSAVTRRTQDGRNPEGWVPEQKLSVADCLYAYMQGSAYAEFSESAKGTLSPGKLADILVVSQDVMTVLPEDIAKTKVLCTIAGGKIIYQT
ncbi:amidohydrolase [Sporomusa aerivorans]|uniref:amidohydrolase n=1 Tax=Sporomusa aerivorans TaxID=204936 RepID=UPI003529E322